MEVWWFPLNWSEPKEILVFMDNQGTLRLFKSVGNYEEGTEINFWYATKIDAMQSHIKHCEERINFFKNRLEKCKLNKFGGSQKCGQNHT